MKCRCKDLIVAFKGFVNRLQQTHLSVSSEEDGRNVSVERTYSGEFSNTELANMAAGTEAGWPNLQQSKIKFADDEIVMFLNMAFERIFNAKMKQVSKFLMDPKVMPTEMDSIIQEHNVAYCFPEYYADGDNKGNPVLDDDDHQVYSYYTTGLVRQSALIQETSHERFGGGSGKGVNEEKTMDNARIFKIPSDYQANGPLTIVTLTIEEFETDNPWLTTDTPLHTRISRPISNNDLASLGALAKNSRYASGGLYRHKRWMDIHGKMFDILEVFHNNEEEDKWYNPFDGAYLFIAFQYILHPAPLFDDGGDKAKTDEANYIYRYENTQRSRKKDNDKNKNPYWEANPGCCWLPITYGYEIAKVAAQIALGKGE